MAQRHAHLKSSGIVRTDASRIDVEAAPDELMAVYAAQMTKADSGIAQITQTLEDLGYLNNTLLLIFSDNGASAEDVSTRGLHNVDARWVIAAPISHTGVTGQPSRTHPFGDTKAQPSKVVFARRLSCIGLTDSQLKSRSIPNPSWM